MIVCSYCRHCTVMMYLSVSLFPGVTIGFDPETYSVNEDGGSVTLTVRVLDGELARPVTVAFNTQDGTATSVAPVDYTAPALPIPLQFSGDQLVQTVVIPIENDDIVENTENFEGVLFTIDPAVILAPMTADVNIVDNDGKPDFHYYDFSV